MSGKKIQNQKSDTKYTLKEYLRFLVPSLLGIFLFMVPLSYQGDVTIPVAFMANQVEALLQGILPALITIILFFVAVMTTIVSTFQPQSLMRYPLIQALFFVQPIWLYTRILGLIFAVMTFFQIGPEWVWSMDTGGLLLTDLIPILFSVFLFAGFLLPLLLNFGLLELCGVLLNKIMRPLFTLPGRSSIDCLASWMGDGTIGVLLTNKQYEEGYYTKREAAVIGTTFSVVSITFSIVILSYMDLEHLFLPFYLTIIVAGFAAAVICPRIPPLSRKKDEYMIDNPQRISDHELQDVSVVKFAIKKAVQRATANDNGFATSTKNGLKNVLDMWFGVIPVVMALGTVALIIAEHTPVFELLGMPFIPILQLLQVPEAAQAAQTMVIGFADMFLPAVIGSGIESEFTRFVIAAVSVTQLIYMSEVGGLLLASKLPVTFKDLVIIFLQRTIIVLPIITLLAHFIF
ncbi:YjiH family protein [Desertibacillus haloalkaliphilus]|uniref:YjiH family protein n=1 Tax=Desertibacillus haloalkaliphilus TaxID=1328930 RepID=UPI001C253038|nr:YjiH family protein [Desertibacillus haloalkaliphilus]MBU8906820.1 YjiH family protein [Desertibacillus haloalkaliphilus]